MNKIRKSFGLILIALVLMMHGCATVPQAYKFPYSTIALNNTSYFDLKALCVRENIAWDYDPLNKIIILKKASKDIRLLIGSEQLMSDGFIRKISAPVELRDGVVYAPVDAANYIIGPICPILPKKTTPSGAYLRSIETVIIDSGHGGKDPGAIGRYGLKEKHVVLDVAKAVEENLLRCGLKAYLTRSTDDFIELYRRPDVANSKKADLFVSIHANASTSRALEGFEVYYLTEAVDDNARALAAAENAPLDIENQSFAKQSNYLLAMLWDMVYTENRRESIELARLIGDSVSKKMGLKMLGVKGAPFAVLKGARMPAVLVEIGYISNREGERKLRDPEYRRRMAEAIAAGIINFKNYAEGK